MNFIIDNFGLDKQLNTLFDGLITKSLTLEAFKKFEKFDK